MTTHLLVATFCRMMPQTQPQHLILREKLWDEGKQEICIMNVQLTKLQQLCDAVISK